MPVLATNKKAFHDYEILSKYEAGIVLNGQEVKSTKKGLADLKGSYITLKSRKEAKLPEIYLINASIPAYQPANIYEDYNPTSPRKLLLTKKEIKSLIGSLTQKGLTLVPLSMYTKHNLIKVKFAKVRGKKKIDKREQIRKKETDRKIQRIMRQKR